MTASKRVPFAEFVRRAHEVHGDKYTYDEASYTQMKAPLKIICPKHGKFTQQGISHLKGTGCPACSGEALSLKRRMPFSEFLRRAREKHGDKYRYDEASYSGMEQKLTVICPVHGRFSQTAGGHLRGYGCTVCSRERKTAAAGNHLPFAEFLGRAREKHGDKYRYDEASFFGREQKLTVICPIHGRFSQNAGKHMHGSGCPACARKSPKRKKTTTPL
jgi:Zn finger protein HypA/HybF involved in hydrogenase expression